MPSYGRIPRRGSLARRELRPLPAAEEAGRERRRTSIARARARCPPARPPPSAAVLVAARRSPAFLAGLATRPGDRLARLPRELPLLRAASRRRGIVARLRVRDHRRALARPGAARRRGPRRLGADHLRALRSSATSAGASHIYPTGSTHPPPGKEAWLERAAPATPRDLGILAACSRCSRSLFLRASLRPALAGAAERATGSRRRMFESWTVGLARRRRRSARPPSARSRGSRRSICLALRVRLQRHRLRPGDVARRRPGSRTSSAGTSPGAASSRRCPRRRSLPCCYAQLRRARGRDHASRACTTSAR